MPTGRVDPDLLERASRRVWDTAIDPGAWPEVMQEISTAAGATGALLLQPDVRTADVPHTASIAALADEYFKRGWHARDVRAEAGLPLLLRGERVVIDQDVLTPEQRARHVFYSEWLIPRRFGWFAAVGFRAGAARWVLSMQRTQDEGPFTAEDKRALAHLSPRLTEAATLAMAVRRSVLSGMIGALDLVQQPAIALDRLGTVIDTNAAADRLFDDDVRISHRRLMVRDRTAARDLAALVDRLRASPDTAPFAAGLIVVRRDARPGIVIRALPISGAARGPFLGARALLILSDLGQGHPPSADVLAQAFSLTAAEARLAALIGAGRSVDEAAAQIGIRPQTVRNQLKAVFAKTGTHRQPELVALLSRLSAVWPRR
jgi:DNA-binding CsgD family transcriptional regulator